MTTFLSYLFLQGSVLQAQPQEQEGSPPWWRMLSAGNRECDAIRVKQPSCPSHIFLQGCGKGRKRRQRDTPQCNVIRVKKPYPAKDDAIFSVLQIHHRWKRRKKKHNLSFCCICECTFSSVFPLATNCPLCPIEESGCQSMTRGLLHTQIGRPLNLKLLLLALHRYHPGATFHSLAHKLLSWRAKFP